MYFSQSLKFSANVSSINRKRLTVHNFISKVESDNLVEFIRSQRSQLRLEHQGLEFGGLNQLAANILNENYNLTIREFVLNSYKIRKRILDTVKAYLKTEDIYVESTNFHLRTPGMFWTYNNTDYGHGIHADNCIFDINNRENCGANNNIVQRHFSAVLYLHECDGGELIFTDPGGTQEIRPTSSVLVIFSSGPENPHGVKKVISGERYNLNMWFTLWPHFNGDRHSLNSMLGSPWYSLMDKWQPHAVRATVEGKTLVTGQPITAALNRSNRYPPPPQLHNSFLVSPVALEDIDRIDFSDPDMKGLLTTAWSILQNPQKVPI